MRLVPEWAAHIAMSPEVLEELDLAQGSLGQDLFAENIGDLLDSDTLVGLVVYSGTTQRRSNQVSTGAQKQTGGLEIWARVRVLRLTHQTIPYAPWPSSLVTV